MQGRGQVAPRGLDRRDRTGMVLSWTAADQLACGDRWTAVLRARVGGDEAERVAGVEATVTAAGEPTRTVRLDPDGDGWRAEVADPLWLLGRQWQLLELRGEDAGSPVTVRVDGGTTPLARWQPVGGRTEDVPPGVPLEAVVERERVIRAAYEIATAVVMGAPALVGDGLVLGDDGALAVRLQAI